MSKRYVITTPIYYVNAVPHIGTMLTTLVSDVTARYQRMRGAETAFLTGTDENATKVKEAAEKLGREPREFVDEISQAFVEVFSGMKISYDDFIRTTEERHKKGVQEFYRRLKANGYIYTDQYEGWYDVSSETFFKESDLIDGKSPDGNEVRWVSEENEFFQLSAFGDRLLAHIEAHPEFIQPEARKNEVVSFIKQGLRDTCITRTNPGWGIPVPGNDEKVIYVWFDALINYISATGWPDAPDWQDRWPADVQWMGKDILTRFHATLWPAMLMGADLPLPTSLVGHAWLLMGGDKISKSKGNVVAPLDLAKELAGRSGCTFEVAVDAVRFYLASTFPYENDATYTADEFDRRYNADLANDLGNALNRSLAMSHKFIDGIIPGGEPEDAAVTAIADAKAAFEAAMDGFLISQAVEAAWSVIRFLNKYIDTRAPWALAKAGDPSLPAVLRSMLLCLRAAEGLVRPILPSAADAIAAQLNLPPIQLFSEIGTAASLPAGVKLSHPQPIFPRLDLTKKPMPETPAEPKATPAPAPEPTVSEITIEDFAKVQLRVGRILEAEPLEGSDKLLKLQVMIGEEKRQVVAGIRRAYQPIDLIGRQVVVVANLKPAKLRGADSQGMLLAAVDADGNAILLQPDREAPEGSTVR